MPYINTLTGSHSYRLTLLQAHTLTGLTLLQDSHSYRTHTLTGETAPKVTQNKLK